jgi:AcrR family transcriptional regulator
MQRSVKSLVEDPKLVARRRAQLVQAAVTLFSRIGYHASTVRDVAEEAGVSAGLVYQYVSDKEELLYLTILDICERVKEVIPASIKGVDDSLARLSISVEAYSRQIATDQRAVRVAYREIMHLKPEHIEVTKRVELETNAQIGNCVAECIRGRYLMATNVELLVYRIVTGAHAWALKSWRLPKIVSFDDYLQQSIHCFWTILLLPKGKRRYAELRLGIAARVDGESEAAKISELADEGIVILD